MQYSTLVALILGSTLLGKAFALRCYVCGSDEANLKSCDNFDPTNEIFTKDCPPDESKSCLTTSKNGTIITRDCESLNVAVCVTANNVTYCYCPGDLCNEKFESDDEDYTPEGSGFFPLATSTVETPKMTVAASAANVWACSFRIIVVALTVQYFIPVL